jgi:hypothetical protein
MYKTYVYQLSSKTFFAPERRMILTLAQKCLQSLGSILVLLQQSSMLCGRSTLCLALGTIYLAHWKAFDSKLGN